MSRRSARILFLGAALFSVTAGIGAYWAWSELNRAHRGWAGSHVDLLFQSGLGAGEMIDRLAHAGVIEHPRLARLWTAWRGNASRLGAGEYRFDRAASALEVLARLERSDVLLHAVTVPEGLTLAETARRFAEGGIASEIDILASFRDPDPIRDLVPQAEDLEGYLFPDTYLVPQSLPPAQIARRLVFRFRDVVGDRYAAQAREVGLSLNDAVTLASLIEKETSLAAERPRIAAVFHNRLGLGMRLECDPTVRFALERAGLLVTRLTAAELRFASPWNTYVVQGLPPSPIASPGAESLSAAVSPARTNELYFVANPGGGHTFSCDYRDHLRASAVWRRYVRSTM